MRGKYTAFLLKNSNWHIFIKKINKKERTFHNAHPQRVSNSFRY